VPANLADADDADGVAETVLARHGCVDVLVNNAGHSIRRPLDRSYDRDHDFDARWRSTTSAPAPDPRRPARHADAATATS